MTARCRSPVAAFWSPNNSVVSRQKGHFYETTQWHSAAPKLLWRAPPHSAWSNFCTSVDQSFVELQWQFWLKVLVHWHYWSKFCSIVGTVVTAQQHPALLKKFCGTADTVGGGAVAQLIKFLHLPPLASCPQQPACPTDSIKNRTKIKLTFPTHKKNKLTIK